MKPERVLKILVDLDWTGHFDLPIEDLRWLAQALAAKLTGPADLCGACGCYRPITVETAMGAICENCLRQANADAAQARKRLEET